MPSASRAVVALVATIATVIIPVLPTPALAYNGNVLIHCSPNVFQRAAVDPLEDYGVTRSAHLHTPAGAMAFSSTTTIAEMMAARTSCASRADHSLIWVPTPMTRTGRPARIISFGYYLINLGHDIRRAPPDGLRFLAGDPHCAGQFCQPIYACINQRGSLLVKHTIPTRAAGCDTREGRGYEMSIISDGQCWDGRSLGLGLGGSSPAAHITAARRCRGRVIPRVRLAVVVGADGLGGYLSSDVVAGTAKRSPGSTGHFDFVFGWKNGARQGRPLTAIVSRCLDAKGFSVRRASCVQLPGRQDATIYAARIHSPVGIYPRCVTGPGCRRGTSFRRLMQRIGPTGGVVSPEGRPRAEEQAPRSDRFDRR